MNDSQDMRQDDRLRQELMELAHGQLRPDLAGLAERAGESEEAVARVLAELEEEGVILGYTAVVDRARLRDDAVTGLIEVRVTPMRDRGFDRIAERIARFPEVSSCYLMSGDYDLMVTVEGRSLREVAEFVSERIASSEHVLSTRTHFILKTYKANGRVLFAGPEDEREVMVL